MPAVTEIVLPFSLLDEYDDTYDLDGGTALERVVEEATELSANQEEENDGEKDEEKEQVTSRHPPPSSAAKRQPGPQKGPPGRPQGQQQNRGNPRLNKQKHRYRQDEVSEAGSNEVSKRQGS